MGKIFDRDGLSLTETTGALGSPALLAEMPFNPEAAPVARLDVAEATELHDRLGEWLEDVAPL